MNRRKAAPAIPDESYRGSRDLGIQLLFLNLFSIICQILRRSWRLRLSCIATMGDKNITDKLFPALGLNLLVPIATVALCMVAAHEVGYTSASDTSNARIDALEAEVAHYQELSDIDADTLFAAIDQFSLDFEERSNLEAAILDLQTESSSLRESQSEVLAQNEELSRTIIELETEIADLNNLLAPDLEDLGHIRVEEGILQWLFSGEVGISVQSVRQYSSRVTITGIATNRIIQIGEQIEFSHRDGECFVILIDTQDYNYPDNRDSYATFSFGCRQIPMAE